MTNYAHYIAVSASAGTGKTYGLVENYLCALLGLDGSGIKKRPHEILALTFTNKASHEMQLRITRELSSLLSMDHHPLYDLAAQSSQPLPDEDEIRRILRALINAPIATFHSFCTTLLRKEAPLFGIEDNFSIISPRDEWNMARNILRPMILAELKTPNPVLESLIARFRLVSGFISLGLIDAMLDLYFRLAENGINVKDLADITHHAKKPHLPTYINDIEQALHHFISLKSSKKTSELLHEIVINFDRFKEQLKDPDEINLAQEFSQLRKKVRGNFGDRNARSTLVESIARLGAALVDYFIADDIKMVAHFLNRFHHSFDQAKQNLSYLSYGDLLLKTRNGLLNDLALRKRIKSNIKHILVDEYQDTSPIQEDIISLLLENKSANHPVKSCKRIIDEMDFTAGPSLFVVGDKKQSIYGFRGADASLFDHMIEKLSSTSNGQFFKRSQNKNYRSHKKIIDFVNLIAAHALNEQNYHPADNLVSHVNDQGHCALWVLAQEKKDLNSSANFACAAYGIAQLLATRNDLVLEDITILVRRIKSARLIKEELLNIGIPSRIIGGDGFYGQQEIVDILSALKLINDPENALALAVVLRSPLVLLRDDEILRIKLSGEQGLSLLSAKACLDKDWLHSSSRTRLNNFLLALDSIKNIMANGSSSDAIDILIDACDLAYALGHEDNPKQKWANIEKLSQILATSKENPFMLIDDLYQRIFEHDKEPLADAETKSAAIKIMTIHQAKGLEFKVVVVADLESALPNNRSELLADKNLGLAMRPKGRMIAHCTPSTLERANVQTRFDAIHEKIRNQEQQEVARILYVALTRAKEELYIAISHEKVLEESKNTLAGSLSKAYRHQREQFLSMCAIEKVVKPTTYFSMPKTNDEIDNKEFFALSPNTQRIFASALKTLPDSKIESFIDQNVGKNLGNVDGALAHSLIAKAGFLLFSENYKLDIETTLYAIYRSGIYSDSDDSATISAVAVSLKILRELSENARQIIFEMPISYWPAPTIMLEGFADLVIEFDDFVGVVEFKSTRSLALDKDSYLQVLAYADALSHRFNKPIQFAVLLIGSEKKPQWQNYHESLAQFFLSSLLAPSEKVA